MDRRDDAFEQHLPARVALYGQVVDLFKAYESTFSKNFSEKHGKTPALTGFLSFVGGRQSLCLPETGIDEADLAYMVTDRLDKGDEGSIGDEGTIDNHDILRICFMVFQDGSPYVMDGDVIEAMYEPANDYYVLLGRELLPFMVQAEQLDNDVYTAESLRDVNKHYLSDVECANLFAYLRNQNDYLDYDEALSG